MFEGCQTGKGNAHLPR